MDQDVVMVAGQNGCIAHANARCGQTPGLARAKVAGRPADKDSPQQRDRMTADLVTQSWPEGEVRNIDKAGSRVRLPGEVSTFAHPDIGNALLSAELNETHEKEIQARLHAQDLQLRAVLDALPANIAVLDRNGTIIAVNRTWSRFAADNGAAGSLADGTGINYLQVCRDAERSGDITAGEAADGIEAVLSGRQNHFSMEYPCSSP
ncbi:MAG: multi-sensor signal transduction histidine kinase, partial [Proteobacteria bacterium]|nr:multi-sensor signal transduction histidine kinase [Pseudomonadota bacterium]